MPAPPLRDDAWTAAPGPPRRLDRALRERFAEQSWSALRRLIATGKVSVDGVVVSDEGATVGGGAALALRMTAPRRTEARRLADDVIEWFDGHLVVVRKPAGLSTVPFDEGERDTLADLLPPLLKRVDPRRAGREELGVVHRIDKETSGLLVFTRTLAAKRALEQQFRLHTVHRRYLALAHGAVPAATHRSRLVQDRGDGLRGSTRHAELGQPSVTHVAPLEALRGATLVECRLETGRTHQIRIHLSEAGHPLVGEKVYVRGFAGPLLPAPRLMLHAAELGFEHPVGGRALRFSMDPPPDFVTTWHALRG